MAEHNLISADSHVVEPRTMWQDYVDPAFRDRAPRNVVNPPGLKPGEYMFFEDMEPKSISGSFNAGRTPEENRESEGETLDDCRPGGYLPAERVPDMELDGIESEVIYTTQGFRMFAFTRDAALQSALFRGYNNWLSEFCSYDPNRFVGLGLIPLLDVEEGVRELRRCAGLGLRGGVIMTSPPDPQSYGDPAFEPFWAAAAELNMPISLHVNSGHGPETQKIGKFKSNHYLSVMSMIDEVKRSISEILFSGVLARCPGLKIVSAENDIGWMPHYVYRADVWYHQQGWKTLTDLKMAPSEYAKRQIYGTFMDDAVGLMLTDYFGEDNFAWASDYPHGASTFPNSRKIVDQNFEGVSEEVKLKVTRSNAIRLYDMNGN